jgi:hypothetical protein
MDYGLIGKIEKAKRYAQEPERFCFNQFTLTFKGNNSDHAVAYDRGAFHCDCEFFQTHGRCAHTMAVEQVLKKMLPPETN